MMSGPLHGLRVLVLAGMGPVPYTSMLLADMGAHVIRVIRPAHRNARTLSQTDSLADGMDPVLRHVDSLALDLKDAADLDTVLQLADLAEVFVEGYRPGVAERLGLGPDIMCERNPRLVYARLTGYGQSGPLAADAGHDINYVAQAGALQAMSRPGENPHPPINLLGDYAGGGMTAAYGIVCALLEARSSGRGQVIDAAMVDGIALLTAKIQGLRAAGIYSDEAGTNFLDGGAPFYDTYRCADGRFIAVGALEPDFYAEFISRLGVDTERWPEQNDRSRWPRLRELLTETIAGRTRDEWASLYAGTDSCVTPVLDFDEAAIANAQRGVFVRVDDVLHPAPAPRMSRTPARPPAAPSSTARRPDDLLDLWKARPQTLPDEMVVQSR